MQPLTGLERPAESQYLNCIRCGLCLAVCPTYQASMKEAASPRGRVALARKGLDGELELTSNLMEQMYGCFACMACDDICPVGIRPAELAMAMRHVQEQKHPAGWKQSLFGELIPHAGRMETATMPLRLYEASGLRRMAHNLGLTRILPAQVRDMESMLPHLPQRPLRQVLPTITETKDAAKRRVGFFLGCAQSLLFAQQSAASVRVLSRNGCEVHTPRDMKCCGMPAHGFGRLDLVREHAQHNIAVFEKLDVDLIITDCATCGSTLKEYGAILQEDSKWASKAVAFSKKVRDISEFLAELPLERPMGRLERRVTYHDPCHLRRAQKVWQQPRELLGLIDGLDFAELPEADWCCGSAGSQLITHYATSLQILDRKMDHLESTGADVIASGCPGCQMQLTAGVRRRKLHVEVMHPIALLEEAYRTQDA